MGVLNEKRCKKFDIEEVLYTNLENGKHNNYEKNLVLNIADPKIHALYNRLGKTIKLTTGGKTRKNKNKKGERKTKRI
jgi:hypothetical protein